MSATGTKALESIGDQPLVSIITACLNGVQFVEQAIQSVLAQDYPNFEHIVIDGGSTDGTLEVVAKYPHLHVVSETDDGLYDAFNKGIGLAKGEIIGILNSDDFYEHNVFSKIVQCFVEDQGLDTVCGGAIIVESNKHGNIDRGEELCSTRYTGLSLEIATLGIPITNARFFRRRVFKRCGLFDTRYQIASDRDFLIRATLSGIRNRSLDFPVYFYRRHAGSLTINRTGHMSEQIKEEYFSIAEKYLQLQEVPKEARRILARWHLTEACQGATSALVRRNLGACVRYMLRGTKQNIFCPFYFVGQLIKRFFLGRYIRLVNAFRSS